MTSQKVIAVFDIGKTNKKLLLFNKYLNVIYQVEKKIDVAFDEDGFYCDDIDKIEKWVKEMLTAIVLDHRFDVKAVNFSTYGATLVFLDSNGKRLTPVYNYLKQVPDSISAMLYQKYDGKNEFCRRTASPALGGLLNAGIQILWLKNQYPETYRKVEAILHFPQYFTYLFSKKITSEYTSIGCHTFLWDFDNNNYHKWLTDENISLPAPQNNTSKYYVEISGKNLAVGIGIHDSSSSLIPYLRSCEDNFILVSTGTWCINMNPFNHSPLTADQLNSDCLTYLSVDQKPVKSSRLFLGYMHDVNLKRIAEWFNMENSNISNIETDELLLRSFLADKQKELIFFKNGIPPGYLDEKVDLSQFECFSEAYHRLIYDLSKLNEKSINIISNEAENVNMIFVSGGFSKNEIFVRLMATFFYDKEIYTSVIENSSALGAALMMWNSMEEKQTPSINMNLCRWKPF